MVAPGVDAPEQGQGGPGAGCSPQPQCGPPRGHRRGCWGPVRGELCPQRVCSPGLTSTSEEGNPPRTPCRHSLFSRDGFHVVPRQEGKREQARRSGAHRGWLCAHRPPPAPPGVFPGLQSLQRGAFSWTGFGGLWPPSAGGCPGPALWEAPGEEHSPEGHGTGIWADPRGQNSSSRVWPWGDHRGACGHHSRTGWVGGQLGPIGSRLLSL